MQDSLPRKDKAAVRPPKGTKGFPAVRSNAGSSVDCINCVGTCTVDAGSFGDSVEDSGRGSGKDVDAGSSMDSDKGSMGSSLLSLHRVCCRAPPAGRTAATVPVPAVAKP